MEKKIIFLILTIVIISIIYTSSSTTGLTVTNNHKIVISSNPDSISVEETLTIKGESQQIYNILKFWIQDEAENINILVNNQETSCNRSSNEYLCNISNLNITRDTSIQVSLSYTLSKNIEKFKKTLTRNTTSISVKFNGRDLYSGTNLESGSYFTLLLYTPSETTLTGYVIAIIALFLILLIVTILYIFKRKTSSKIKELAGESEELLNTKKKLLVSLLKEVEKKHRTKQISEDTYHKLKSQYKQHAVETMKKIEDMKSKVK